MPSTQAEAAKFYPPHVTPPPKPLGFPHNLRKLISNNLEAIPEEAYHGSLVLAPGPPRIAFIVDLEIVKTILLDRYESYPKGRIQKEVLKPLFGNAMHAKEGAEWKWQRGAVAPLFRHSELLQYGPTMTAVAEATVEAWRTAPPGTVRAGLRRSTTYIPVGVRGNAYSARRKSEVWIPTVDHGNQVVSRSRSSALAWKIHS